MHHSIIEESLQQSERILPMAASLDYEVLTNVITYFLWDKLKSVPSSLIVRIPIFPSLDNSIFFPDNYGYGGSANAFLYIEHHHKCQKS